MKRYWYSTFLACQPGGCDRSGIRSWSCEKADALV